MKKSDQQKLSNWFLYGISEAAKRTHPIRLQMGINEVGRSARLNTIALNSNLCSRQHCTMVVSENEIIVWDANVRYCFKQCF